MVKVMFYDYISNNLATVDIDCFYHIRHEKGIVFPTPSAWTTKKGKIQWLKSRHDNAM